MKMNVNGISELVVEVESMDKAIEFWHQKLGFPIVDQWGYTDGGSATVDKSSIWATWLYVGGNTRLGLWLPRRFNEQEQVEKQKAISSWSNLFDEGGVHVHFALHVAIENVGEVLHVLQTEDIDYKVIVEEMDSQREYRIYFKDTEKNIIELYTRNMVETYKGVVIK
ncbi:VOC family protein [Geomicrobium sp. JSM 1781026]|uniref:VOC family protein n=1 Tax=Geomicrobium sp. JSM 1781026 TaxID=3344580 RepID=UPI0035BFED6A